MLTKYYVYLFLDILNTVVMIIKVNFELLNW